MSKKSLEIGMSVGLVLLMIALMLVIQMAAPEGLRSAGFVFVVLLFIISMGVAGFKLIGVD